MLETFINNPISHTKESQSLLSPKDAMQILQKGNERFVTDKPLKRNRLKQVVKTSTGQFPFAAIVSCIDSRIPTEIIFDLGIGAMFNARIAGNFVNEDILGSLEFACKLAGSKVILVLGHTSCGAVKGACDKAELGNLTQMLKKIEPAVNNTKTEKGENRNSGNLDFVNRVAEENVRLTIDAIKKDSPVLNEMFINKEIDIRGAMYDVNTGLVHFKD